MIQAMGPTVVVTPGTPVRVTHAEPNPAEVLKCHGVLFQALKDNLGFIYIGTATMNKSTGEGVFAVLPVPSTNLLPTFSAALTISPNALRLEDFYIDADNGSEGVICTILVM